jgi:hypothetical protein
MKIPLKYGLLVTLGMMAWVLIMHSVITNPQSIVHTLGGPVFFNVLQFAMIYLGLKALEHEKRDSPTFKEGLKTGVAISFVYGLTASIFFAIALATVGTKWMANDPGTATVPRPQLLLAFLALFIGAVFLGLIYSTVLSFFLAKRRSED